MERGGGMPLILFNIIFAGLAFMALKIGGWSSVATLFTVAAYFTISSSVFVLAGTGGLRDIILSMIDQGSSVLKLIIIIFLQRRQQAAGKVYDVDLVQEISQINPGDYRTYVPAIPQDDSRVVKQQARAWLLGLCDERTGELSSDKLHMTNSSSDGWLKVKAPHGDVRRYLLQRGVLVAMTNGLALDRDKIGSVGDIDIALKD